MVDLLFSGGLGGVYRIVENMTTILGMLGTVVAFGVAGFMRKLAMDRIHPYQLQVVAGIVYVGFIPVWLWVIGRDPMVGGYDRVGIGYGVVCVMMSMLGAVILGNLLRSTDEMVGMISAVTTWMSPVVTGLLCWGLLGEEYTLRQFIAIMLMMLGVVLFSY